MFTADKVGAILVKYMKSCARAQNVKLQVYAVNHSQLLHQILAQYLLR